MIIKICESDLFTKDPAIRFAEQYQVSSEIYKELWRRHKLLDYTVPELCEVYYIKIGKPIKRRKMEEWMFRGEVYMKTYDVMKRGVEAVNSEFFGDLEQRVVNEILRHIKYDNTKDTRSLA
jgi:hypothetical protein